MAILILRGTQKGTKGCMETDDSLSRLPKPFLRVHNFPFAKTLIPLQICQVVFYFVLGEFAEPRTNGSFDTLIAE